jgi:hypothetical protein
MELAREEEHIELAAKALLKSLKADDIQALRISGRENFKFLRDIFFASCFHVVTDEEASAVNILPAVKLHGEIEPRDYKQ